MLALFHIKTPLHLNLIRQDFGGNFMQNGGAVAPRYEHTLLRLFILKSEENSLTLNFGF